ncbi:MAG: hypothetical protein WC505_03875 [Patescibacteria group bacterium]
MHTNQHNQGGYIALIAVLIIVVVTLSIGLSMNVLSIGETQSGLRTQQAVQSFTAADACMQEAYLRLEQSGSYAGGSLNVGFGSCTITVVDSGPVQKTITVTADVSGIQRKFESTVTLTGSVVSVDAWKELNS